MSVSSRFVKATMNVIDVLGILPYFLSLGLSIVNRSNGIRYSKKSELNKKNFDLGSIL